MAEEDRDFLIFMASHITPPDVAAAAAVASTGIKILDDAYLNIKSFERRDLLRRYEAERKQKEERAYVEKLRARSAEEHQPHLFVHETAEDVLRRRQKLATEQWQDDVQQANFEEQSRIVCIEHLQMEPRLEKYIQAAVDDRIGDRAVRECFVHKSTSSSASSPLFVFLRFYSTKDANEGKFYFVISFDLLIFRFTQL